MEPLRICLPYSEMMFRLIKESLMKIKFDDIRSDIINALMNRSLKSGETLDLIDGFGKPHFSRELDDSELQGCIIPMVMGVGIKTGRVYFFPLKELLPNIEL